MKNVFYLAIALTLLACNGESGDLNHENKNTNESKVRSQVFKNTLKEQLDSLSYNNLVIDIATYVLRKPDAATWQTKFNPEFRAYFTEKSKELELYADLTYNDTIYVYLIRDARDNQGKANRGVGLKMVKNTENKIVYFEEIFVTKILNRINLEGIGQRFLTHLKEHGSLNDFISNNNQYIEWPDGRLFYSVEKSEWRYVD
jgi:hypothetical protein